MPVSVSALAYLYVRNDRAEIREARSTPRGPRSRTLVSFRGALTDAHLDRASAVARREIDRAALRARAEELGIGTARVSADAEARALIGRLRTGAPLDPVLVGLLREQLDARPAAAVPEDLADVVEWIGASEHERGRTLRGLLRVYDRIARPDATHARESERFPRFEVRPTRRVS